MKNDKLDYAPQAPMNNLQLKWNTYFDYYFSLSKIPNRKYKASVLATIINHEVYDK